MKKIIIFFSIIAITSTPENAGAQQIALEPYFDGIESTQPNIKYGGCTIALAVNPDNDNEVIAATHTGGLMKTTNHAGSWTTLFDFPGGHWVKDVDYAPMNTNNVIVVTANNMPRNFSDGGIWLSRNGGNSWIQPPSSLPQGNFLAGFVLKAYCISTYPGSRRVIAGTNAGLAISDDDGETWRYDLNIPGSVVQGAALLRNNEMVVSTPSGIYYWNNGWFQENTGIGMAYFNITLSSHNAFYVPSGFMNNNIGAFVSAANPVFVVNTSQQIYFSNDGGRNWNLIDQIPVYTPGNAKGTCFIKFANPDPGMPQHGIDLYAGNLYGVYKKFCPKTGAGFNYNYSAPWIVREANHSDISDLCLNSNGDPWLLAGDGGVQKFIRNPPQVRLSDGNHFIYFTPNSFGGNDNNGLNALQVYEVSGMYIRSRGQHDIYFGTQDNNLYASGNTDGGGNRVWSEPYCCEGLGIQSAGSSMNEESALFSFNVSNEKSTHISNRLFSNNGAFRMPPGFTTNEYPVNLDFQTFMLYGNTNNNNQATNSVQYYLTTSYLHPQNHPAWYLISTPVSNNLTYYGIPQKSVIHRNYANGYVVFQGYKAGNDQADNNSVTMNIVKPMRLHINPVPAASGAIYNVNGFIRYPANINFGSLGYFNMQFMSKEIFAVNPTNYNELIAADAFNKKMMRSTNAGESWQEIPELTAWVTENGSRPFNVDGRYTNASSLAYNPAFPKMILAGTRESGIFYSWNGGSNWDKIPESEKIPEVTSFYFQNNNTVWVSSYGRGLWKLSFTIKQPRSALFYLLRNREIYTLNDASRITRLLDNSGTDNNNYFNNEYDNAMLATDGTMMKVELINGMVQHVQYTSNSSVIWLSDEKDFKPLIKIKEFDGNREHDPARNTIADLADKGFNVCGLLMKGNQLVDVLYSKDSLPFPFEKNYPEYIESGEKELNTTGKVFFHVRSNESFAGHCTIKPGQKIYLNGSGFDPSSGNSVQLLLDGKATDIFGNVLLDKDGGFMMEKPIELAFGSHTISAQQINTKQQLIGDTDELVVVNSDESGDTIKEEIKQPDKNNSSLIQKVNDIKNRVKKIVEKQKQ